MSAQKMVPSGSQTVGPYFRIGLEHLVGKEPANESALETIKIHGKILDRRGAAVPDALLEFWEQIRPGHIPTPFPTRMVIQLDFTAWGRKSMAAFL